MIKRIGISLALALVLALGFSVVTSAQFDTFLEVTRVLLGDGVCELSTGSGSPEGVVTGDVCDTFQRTDGGAGTTLYIKESGTGNTGWVAIATGAGGVTGTGTANQMTRWQSASVIEDASMTDAEVVTGTTTDVFTNKSYDVEGTGNVFGALEVIALLLGSCDASTPDHNGWNFVSGSEPSPDCTEGTANFYVLDYIEDESNNLAQYPYHLPADQTGTIDVHIKWFSVAIVGDVVWDVASACAGDGETSNPAFNTSSTVTDTAQGTTLFINTADITSLTITGCSPGDILFLQVARDSSTGADTLVGDASLAIVELTVRRSI